MVVVFEFLSEEPIENLITCMNFKVDKLVLFGNYDRVISQKEKTECFLKKYCGVKDVLFRVLSEKDLQSVLSVMRQEIEAALKQNAELYFDITGGESLMLVAFGMLSKEYKTPIHLYDVSKCKLIELDEGAEKNLSKDVERQKIELNLEAVIEMHGGKINDSLHKETKTVANADAEKDILGIWEVMKRYSVSWNLFSQFMRDHMQADENGEVIRKEATVLQALKASPSNFSSVSLLNQILDALGEAGVLLDVVHAAGMYRFSFKNRAIKSYLWDGGSVLELYTYLRERKSATECQVGVYLDWDGVLHGPGGGDVFNEIDVLALHSYIPTFISCKSGNMSPQQILHSFYELDTLANRFGGKYAKRLLVLTMELTKVYQDRAKEMRIELRFEK